MVSILSIVGKAVCGLQVPWYIHPTRRQPPDGGETTMRFSDLLNQVIRLLVREGRITYWALKQEFGLDEAFLEGLRDELILAKRVAVDEGGKVLVWTGGPYPFGLFDGGAQYHHGAAGAGDLCPGRSGGARP